MTYVKQVSFDPDGAVSSVLVDMDKPEYEFMQKVPAPPFLFFPTEILLDAEQAAALFQQATRVKITDPEYATSNEIYWALMPVVERFIEYDS